MICAHLPTRCIRGPRLPIPETGRARQPALRLEALADGMADAGNWFRWDKERRPEALRWPAMVEAQSGKLQAAYEFVEQEVALDGPLDIGQIALASALGWLEFRRLPWLGDRHRRLAAWYRSFAGRRSMVATGMRGETQD